jgi:hypothetical protein
MNEQQIEWLRTHQIMHCPAAPEVGLPFHKGTEADAIANYAMMGETLDLNADTSLVPGSVLAVRRAKQRKQREETKMGRQRREIDLESLKADYEGGMPGQMGRSAGRQMGRKSQITNRKSPMKQLFPLWKRLAKQRGISGDRLERLHYSSAVLGREVESWTTLESAEMGQLVRAMYIELRTKRYILHYVLWLARRLYGGEWDSMLHQRLERSPYLYYGSVTELDPRRMHGLIEEMLDRLARAQAETRNSKFENREELRKAKEALRKEMVAAVRGGKPAGGQVGRSADREKQCVI